MKKSRLTITGKKFRTERLLVTVLFLCAFFGMSFGYAAYNTELSMLGDVTLYVGNNTGLNFTEHTIDNGLYNTVNDVSYESVSTSSGVNIVTDIVAYVAYNYEFKIEYTLFNDSSNYYTYTGSDSTWSYTNYGGETEPIKYARIQGITKGDMLSPGETRTVEVIYYSDLTEKYDGSYAFNANIIFTFAKGEQDIDAPSVLGTLETNEAVFNSSNIAKINMTILNLYDCSREVSFELSNKQLELLSLSGESTDFTRLLDKGTTEGLIATFHLKDAYTYTEPVSTKVYMKVTDGKTYEIGEVTLTKTITEEEEQGEVLTNVTITPQFVQGNWAAHSDGTITIVNNNDFEITEWKIKMVVNEEAQVQSVTSHANVVSFDSEANIISVYSTNPYVTTSHQVIPANGSITVEGITVEHTGVVSYLAEWDVSYYDVVAEKITIDALINGEWHLGMTLE